MNTYFNFEIYTSNPKNPKETGFDIFFVSVKAETISEAKENLKKFPNFDCIILFNYTQKEPETDLFLIHKGYMNHEITLRLNF